MGKETAFADPPGGHVAGLVYDAVNDQWIAQRATLWTYDDRWVENLGETKSGNGTYSGSSTAVPAGEVWVLEHAFQVNQGGARGATIIYVIHSSVEVRLAQILSPAQHELVSFTDRITLKEDDIIRIDQASCIDGDGILAAVWGYKMKVPF